MAKAEKIRWDRLLDSVRTHHTELYRNWFEDLRPGELLGGQLRVLAKDPGQARFLREQCTTAFNQAAMSITGHLISVQFTSADEPSQRILGKRGLTRAPLNPDYSFEEFVVGNSNRLAHAACRAICNEPGSLYNPLFIHGASGLGKSHLLQATCDAMLRVRPNAEVAYISCETFVNDFVRAIESGTLSEFRENARGCDLLVIDDVQFLANRESSQEELFHTFNALYQTRNQIVLSAVVLPSEIPTLEDRLVSRFSG
ncbi:MAG: DnaA/Hda family protein, partial [Phycisphaerae bacterium]